LEPIAKKFGHWVAVAEVVAVGVAGAALSCMSPGARDVSYLVPKAVQQFGIVCVSNSVYVETVTICPAVGTVHMVGHALPATCAFTRRQHVPTHALRHTANCCTPP
jgi:hypothetical protein